MRKILKIICYFIYYGFVQYLPRPYEMGFIGRFSHWLRWVVCRPLIASHEGNLVSNAKLILGVVVESIFPIVQIWEKICAL